MEWIRFDVSTVRPQGGYVAKQCPVRAQWDVIRPADPVAPSDDDRARMDAGVEFERLVVDQLVAAVPDAVVIPAGSADDRALREQLTVQAMEQGAPVIIGGRLPVDLTARRVGEPDLLLAAPGGGYHPADVKHHRTLGERDSLPAQLGDLSRPWSDQSVLDGERNARKRKDDLFQLAHYRRMLEACGWSAGSNLGAIVGSEQLVTWFDLDQPMWRTPSLSEGRKVRSTMDVYDFEFAFRLDITAVAQQHLADPSVELLVVPVKTRECWTCPWHDHCHELLTRADDVSLLPRSTWRSWRAHQDRGVHSVADLAQLDHRSADLVDRGVDLSDLFDKVDAPPRVPDDTPLTQLVSARRHVQLDKLAEVGVLTAGDVRTLDRRVADYAGSGARHLAESIDLARARAGSAEVLLRRGSCGVDVRRADLEIDLDLESTPAGVYLWGALVTNRSGVALGDHVVDGYRSFVTWDDPEATELATFEAMIEWLDGARRRADRAGLSVGVYCYHELVEAGAMRRLAGSPAADGRWIDPVDSLVESDDWVDLLAVAREHLVTGAGMGLKHLAPMAGFEWEDDDPGGAQSMRWHEIAVTDPDPQVRDEYRRRILRYNRNDVEATLALREWMDRQGPTLPRLADTDAARGWATAPRATDPRATS